MSDNSHEIKVRVRYCETDAMGYLHHANYFNFFELDESVVAGRHMVYSFVMVTTTNER